MTITVPDSTVDATQTLVYKVEANSWSGNTITVDIKGNSSGTTFARTTVDATARYNAGVSSGWNSAAATVNRVEDTSAKTLTFRYPTTYPDSNQSVYYLGATVSTSGSASSYTNYTWNVGLGTTWKYLFFTASIGGITRQIAVQVRINASNVTPS